MAFSAKRTNRFERFTIFKPPALPEASACSRPSVLHARVLQVYYVGLLGGTNDMELLARTGVGRYIKRHYCQPAEIEAALAHPMVQKQIELMRIRNMHPAFAGEIRLGVPTEHAIEITWTLGKQWIKLSVDFSACIFFYVAAECAVYVWLPRYLEGYSGSFITLAAYAVSVFFVLRDLSRFLGIWALKRFQWTSVMALFSLAIFICFAGGTIGGMSFAIWLFPLSGLFMSMIYPTLNSKGISCFPKTEHGAVSGVILFFTCASVALGPPAVGAVGDVFGLLKYGFILATVFAALLFAGLLLNWIYSPAKERLAKLDPSEYRTVGS